MCLDSELHPCAARLLFCKCHTVNSVEHFPVYICAVDPARGALMLTKSAQASSDAKASAVGQHSDHMLSTDVRYRCMPKLG